ncbi:MAG TPA: hypothetical protein VJY15_23430 [Candidatus Acidoferrum sp.]|nr:hypothetical protein [Candidatus Acidoferrum sp.]
MFVFLCWISSLFIEITGADFVRRKDDGTPTPTIYWVARFAIIIILLGGVVWLFHRSWFEDF